jgi:hypothetical protein
MGEAVKWCRRIADKKKSRRRLLKVNREAHSIIDEYKFI